MKPFYSDLTSGRRGSCPPAFLPSRGRRPAREIATRELRSEWSISKPARALRTLRRPPHRRRLRCWVVMRRLEAQPGPLAPSGAFHTSGVAGMRG